MKEKKFQNRLIIIWTVTTLVVFVLYIAQELLPIIFKNNKYMDMLMDGKYTLLPLVFCFVVFSIFGIAITFKKAKIQEGINMISKKKSNRFIAMFFSVLLCASFILLGLSSVVAGVSGSTNVKTIKGTVENVISTSDDDSGEVYTLITVKDSKGKSYNLDKTRHLDGLKVNKKDTIQLDYVKTIDQNSKVSDGTILGYTSYIDKFKK